MSKVRLGFQTTLEFPPESTGAEVKSVLTKFYGYHEVSDFIGDGRVCGSDSEIPAFSHVTSEILQFEAQLQRNCAKFNYDLEKYPVTLVNFTHDRLLPVDKRSSPFNWESEAGHPVLPVKILRRLDDGVVLVKTFQPYQMNIGFGPTFPQQYYRLDPDGTFKLYFQQIPIGFEKCLLKGWVDEPIGRDRLKWEKVDDSALSCQVCLDPKKLVEMTIFNCLHWGVCQDCAVKCENCHICREKVVFGEPLVEV